jgi:hypothetical protein
MIVPNYWAEARTTARVKDRSVTLRRFGWSELSAADALAQAELRVADAAQRAARGEPVDRRDRKVAYNGAQGLPIREEVLARHGQAVITRNAYGARCLNVPDLLIADVDFEARPSGRAALICSLVALAVFSCVVARSGMWPAMLAALIAAPIAGLLLAQAWFRLKQLGGSPSKAAERRVRKFCSAHPDWRLRVYRTPAGLRLIATHARFTPAEETVQAFFKAVGVDPLYVRMCLNQHCFRARLTAKPWRIGIASHLKPRPGIWPAAPECLPARRAWVERYEAAAAGYAACRLEKTLGTGIEDPGLTAQIALHDVESNALDTTQPLA